MAGPYGAGKRPARVRRANQLPPDTKKGCCPMAAAVRSARQGRFRLAQRYAVMSVRLLAARIA